MTSFNKTSPIGSATPFLKIQSKAVVANLDRLTRYTKQHGLKLRPHTKTHKSTHFSKLQLRFGACGLTTAKVSEAEVMAAASDDLLIAFPALDSERCRRLAELATTRTVRVAVDSTLAADHLGAAAHKRGVKIGILVDLDVGFHRTGVQTAEASVDLAQHVKRDAGLRLDGLFCYAGHIWELPDQQKQPLQLVADRIDEAIGQWHRHGLKASIVSGGSTPTAYQSHLIPQLTEIRPGTYIFNDMNTVLGGFCSLADCAANVVCTVVSNSVPGKVVIDAGTKTLTSDRNVTQPDSGFGYVMEYPQAKIVRLSEEHGEVDISRCDKRPELGDRISVIPNHICPCVNLQDSVVLEEEDGSFSQLLVEARGKLI